MNSIYKSASGFVRWVVAGPLSLIAALPAFTSAAASI